LCKIKFPTKKCWTVYLYSQPFRCGSQLNVFIPTVSYGHVPSTQSSVKQYRFQTSDKVKAGDRRASKYTFLKYAYIKLVYSIADLQASKLLATSEFVRIHASPVKWNRKSSFHEKIVTATKLWKIGSEGR
jgi:hypothetical protein